MISPLPVRPTEFLSEAARLPSAEVRNRRLDITRKAKKIGAIAQLADVTLK